MFILNKEKNSIEKINSCSFHDLGYGERAHLQEWIANNPSSLCDNNKNDLLIIQKEFDGFNDTSERLDLLALDRAGAIVVIENKLDDTGKDVTWQALKYVSYCSTLKSQQIKDIYQSYLDKYHAGENAEENISEFFHGKPFDEIPLNVPDQRMILVARNFRKEVTSTAMWMLEHNLKVQCFKATPYKWNNEVFLDIEQIIPVKEAEEYMIKMADKNREIDEKKESLEGIEQLRKAFWTTLLERYRTVDSHFNNVNPTTDHWLSGGSGVSGCPFSFIMTTTYAGIELKIGNGEQDRNKQVFDLLQSQKNELESAFGEELIWERLDDRKMSRIAYRLFDVNLKNDEDWDAAISFLCNYMPKLIHALKQPLKLAAGR